ncbi:helicase-exonuclease AddAB subunit AddA [Weizmannia acidilactici]|uniref:helicase-exonuclease AddAB subunit AddA n=1 Tax=Weizmannia acidilactici TaxID=2607726 RepID=UPI00124D6C77|nr:helicase-exonuclease AddAB subunit AddA [Weizmannia acidilactici]GER65768.1 ATP-dependent helicase/nuclease subunit A [Weizmannia acidilactici]GER72672.1 ATP-dependent helicase/nuclease subunit A [Weizmannia acidilactici]
MKTAIPAKPAGALWTDDQWKAVMAKGQDILVAAAAGSGKTAVLVERIIQKLLDEEDPLDIDELLVVTFTNAAAAEMRHRIGEAIEAAISSRPDSRHLRKQLSLLNKASISTLHSFCLEVIRKYYYLIDIDPGFRIADDTEAELLRDEVLDDLFEAEYGKEDNDAFYRVVDTFSNDRSDEQLQHLIRRLYDFSRSHPDPSGWLDKMVEMYAVGDRAELDALPFMAPVKEDIRLQLQAAKEMLEEAYELSKQPGGPAPRAENYLDDVAVVDRLLSASTGPWQNLYEKMNTWTFTRAKMCKGDDYEEELVQAADDLRKSAKKILEGLKKDFFTRKPESFLNDMKEMQPVIATLAELVKKFSTAYANVKAEKGLADFSDLEHFCLEILTTKNENGGWVPSEAAKAYQAQFKEVLIDEYQDVNMVQETIIRLVTRGSGYDGNLFMVGDVKQSIYRFRLAEPNLFLSKYQAFDSKGEHTGLRIDLSKNFRSRKEILDGTNFIFKQIMGVHVGEMEYDEQAALVKGASYPEGDFPIEVAIIDQADEEAGEDDAADMDEDVMDKAELEQSQLESRYLARTIQKLIQEKQPVYNPKTGTFRPIQYKDIVILMRSMTWAPEMVEEFKQAGIPLYAELSTGYFDATEVAVMLSLLKVIDNPYQDIPLAVVLRSPIVGLNEEELARIRIHAKRGPYYEAVKKFISDRPEPEEEEVHEKVSKFAEKLSEWRSVARQGDLSSLIWQLYRGTKFYDFVGGLPGGKQRQANLRALYDRARQYEETSFRGLFRFLRFIERMQERGDDLGTARALSEQEDVVRLMTIHASKGLEFPVVFVAGLNRKFNMRDINQAFLFDKDFGFACKYISPQKRIIYPSLPHLAFKRKKKLEMLAEEMRVLYVALTRAKEKLYLVGTVKNLKSRLEKWKKVQKQQSWLIKDHLRASANSYLDWIGPALARHEDAEELFTEDMLTGKLTLKDPSRWNITLIPKEQFGDPDGEETEPEEDWQHLVKAGLPVAAHSEWKESVFEHLSWRYKNETATLRRAKQSVSELKRMNEERDETNGTQLIPRTQKHVFDRPRFMQEKSITPAERGTAMHMVMQHIPLDAPPTYASVEELIDDMIKRELLTEEQADAIAVEQLVHFFETEIGETILQAEKVMREMPFSLSLPASEIYRDKALAEERVLVQGIFDCVVEEKDGLILLDFKSDRIQERFKGGFEEAEPVLRKRYEIQLTLYGRALETILKRKVKAKYLYFFNGGHVIKVH